jgi:hypothetical protein
MQYKEEEAMFEVVARNTTLLDDQRAKRWRLAVQSNGFERAKHVPKRQKNMEQRVFLHPDPDPGSRSSN